MTMITNKEMLYRERKAELDKKIQPKKRNVKIRSYQLDKKIQPKKRNVKIRSYQRQINTIQAKMRKGDVR